MKFPKVYLLVPGHSQVLMISAYFFPKYSNSVRVVFHIFGSLLTFVRSKFTVNENVKYYRSYVRN